MWTSERVKRREFLRASSFISVAIALSGCNSYPEMSGWHRSPTPTPKPMTEFDATEPDSFTREERKSVEREIHNLVNSERREHDLRPIDLNGDVTYIARTKSRDMAVEGYFAHKEPDGDFHVDRLEDYGYELDVTAENLSRLNVNPDTAISVIAERVVHSWMKSPPHRREILYPDYNLEGVGVYVTSDYTIYVTQIFDT